MAFRIESSLDGAPPIVETALMTDSEAGTTGSLVYFSSGKLTLCATTTVPDGILVKTTLAGTSVSTEFVRLRRDHTVLADYTSTAPVIGSKVYAIDATGLLVNGGANTGGKIIIKSIDTAKTKCRIGFDL